MALFVNRKAYTRQSANPHPETSRRYHNQPKNKDSGQLLELDSATVHLAGWITVGLYAINLDSQRCKWIATDADCSDTFFDLGKLKGELELDDIYPGLEMSRRGGHLRMSCAQPLLAQQCRVYIYNVALRLGVPHQGSIRFAHRIELFFPGRANSRLINLAMLCAAHSESIVPTTTATGFTMPAVISPPN